MKRLKLTAIVLALGCVPMMAQRHQNFNAGWRIGDNKNVVTLPHAWNEDYAFKVGIANLPDSVVWYRKDFKLKNTKGKKVFIEFEGVRQAGEFFINGHNLGLHENGVMAVGFDLTPYIKDGMNSIEVRTDNSWTYHENESNSRFQWNDKNFNANYGGIPKNVWLHVTDEVYQTLPLYSNLKTTGVYVYASDFDIAGHKATIHAESQVTNDSKQARTFHLEVAMAETEGNKLLENNGGLEYEKGVKSQSVTLQPGETAILKAEWKASGLHFWSWGYGYLYDVTTRLASDDGKAFDEVVTRTGFRKTQYGEGKIWLNDRVLQMKGYAQRTSNEWPAVGISVPAWLSDFSNGLQVQSGANLVRWMHVTPWKQDVESCDRVGLIQAMPAGDSEKDVADVRWRQRTDLMRDAIIYNRNNPSILFYEGGNESISREHVVELQAIRNQYDPHGGRAVGSREMLDIDESEYGGEMLYINKSKKHPMWAMEYSRDEGLRKYWDEYSYPYHREGDGPLYRDQGAEAWNHNQDQMAIENVRRWFDYWQERPGTGTRVSSGGVKIIFSDTNTHYRGAENYRRSGATDAMRIPKDGFFANQVMWHGWVDNDDEWQTYIIGHWNYQEAKERHNEQYSIATAQQDTDAPQFAKPVYVVSNGEEVELFLNGRSLGKGERSYNFLFTWRRVVWEPGELVAVSRDADGKELSRHTLQTAGEPASIRLTAYQNPAGFQADGADMVLLQMEVVDKEGRRLPLDNRMIRFEMEGPAEWRGGIGQGPDNYILSKELPVECGINRALIRSTTKAGKILVKASAEGLPVATLELRSVAPTGEMVVSNDQMKIYGQHGETPLGQSYVQTSVGVEIESAEADGGNASIANAYDDNELSEWKGGYWATFHLKEKAPIDDVCIKLSGWRTSRYPLEVYADGKMVWSGTTPTSLGYVHLKIKEPVEAKDFTLRIAGTASDSNEKVKDNIGGELAGGKANELDQVTSTKGKQPLRIVEVEFLRSL